MRAIKFRFWNQIAQRFQPPSKYAIDGEGKLVAYDYEMGAYDEPVEFSKTIITPQQYTGLKDRNGKEIYEGDIISIKTHNLLEKVVFLGGAFGVHFNYKNCQDGRMKDNSIQCFEPLLDLEYYGLVGEVKGNVLENPELLKQ